MLKKQIRFIVMTWAKKLLLCLLIPFLLLGSFVLADSLWQLAEIKLNSSFFKILGITGLASAVFFLVFRLNALYVFGHEATHWLMAKLTGHETGRFACHGAKGYVEIKNPGIWITLAPYFVPFYFLILTGLAGLWLTWGGTHSPEWTKTAIGCLLTASLVFHLVMTGIALAHGQSDLQRYGVCFSLALILTLNLLFLYVAAIICSSSWLLGFQIPFENTKKIVELLFSLRK